MAAALPVTKLAGLLVKTFAKPLSKNIKNNLGRYDNGKKILVSIGQTSHKVTQYMTILASGYRVKSIAPLESEKALKVGAEFVGEGFVLAVSMGVVIYEYNRSAASAARKSEEKRERIRETQRILQAKLNALDIRIKAVEDLVKQQQELEENKTLLNRVVPVGGTEKPKYVEPPKEKLVPIDDNAGEDDSSSTAPISSDKPVARPWWKVWG